MSTKRQIGVNDGCERITQLLMTFCGQVQEIIREQGSIFCFVGKGKDHAHNVAVFLCVLGLESIDKSSPCILLFIANSQNGGLQIEKEHLFHTHVQSILRHGLQVNQDFSRIVNMPHVVVACIENHNVWRTVIIVNMFANRTYQTPIGTGGVRFHDSSGPSDKSLIRDFDILKSVGFEGLLEPSSIGDFLRSIIDTTGRYLITVAQHVESRVVGVLL
mmetsp:Transcript_49215/g.73368  ORF Transcript_49215/g.73368 Transcript_49215/m.73368 type:complete len:217 (+) Transcript_49215:826-1476(+)